MDAGAQNPLRTGSEETEADAEDNDWLCCRACGAGITRNRFRSAVEGRVSHTKVNPAGILFVFATFSKAPGAVAAGTATTAHTWFAGHAWRLALCAACAQHLGWLFTGPESSFWGLIADRMVQGCAPAAE